MTYKEHVAAADKFTEGQIAGQIGELARDPRFSAIIGWMERNISSWGGAVSAQSLADSHGRLAHAAGSLHAIHVLRGQLINLVDVEQSQCGMEQ